jgi:hypothetical protein
MDSTAIKIHSKAIIFRDVLVLDHSIEAFDSLGTIIFASELFQYTVYHVNAGLALVTDGAIEV